MSKKREFHVWQGGLSGRFYAAWIGASGAVIGEKYDVTEDVERIIAERSGEPQ